MYLVLTTNLSDVFEVNGGIEVGDILNARLDHQVLLACVGEGAKGHNPLWGSLVIASPSPTSTTPESPSASSPASVTTSEPTSSTAASKAHDCRLCNKRQFKAWGSGKLGEYQRGSCLNPTLQTLTDEIFKCGFRHARYKLLFQRRIQI